MPERYAIYYAPAAGSPLSQRAAQWLGRAPADVPGLPADQRHTLTTSARRYGFHATLKAPIALADGRSDSELEAALAGFAATHAPLAIGPLILASLDGFLALVPAQQTQALTEFAQAVVEAFETFRAPTTPADRERRLRSPLSARQVDLLDRFGYPYVMEQFRFHMTLTDRLDAATAGPVSAAASAWFAPVLGAPVSLDRLVLFHQPAADAPFERLRDFRLAGAAP